MITLAQLDSREGAELHYTGRSECQRVVGVRGGVTERVVRVRENGRIKTWKTRPGEFSAPYKYGMRDCFRITHWDVADYHVSADCPLLGDGGE
jgi:hypothetical protein